MDSYSRLIAWLKVLLPLMALALMSTLFLFSRSSDPTAAIPFADADMRDRVAGQQITGPFFSGTTEAGHQVSMSAARILTQRSSGSENNAEQISVQMDLAGGTRVVLFADTGNLRGLSGEATLAGDVRITTSDGYRLTSDLLEAQNGATLILSPGPVRGDGPFGTLDAGAMRLETLENETGDTHLLFTDGVRLIYEPSTEGE